MYRDENLLFIGPYTVNLSNELPPHICAHIDTVTCANYATRCIVLFIVRIAIWCLTIQQFHIL